MPASTLTLSPIEASGLQSFAGSRVAWRTSLRVFLVFLAIYLFTWGGHYTSGDGAHKVAWAKVLLFGPSASNIAPDSNGLYSKYGIGHSLIAMPGLAVSAFVQKHTGIHCEAALYTLIFVINGALLLSLVAFYLLHFYPAPRVWLTVSLIGLATTWWPYTKLDFSEPLVATLFFAGFLVMRFGRPALGMMLAASIITVRTDGVILLALLAAWWLFRDRSIKSAAKLLLGLLPSLAVVFAANYLRYHSVIDRGYSGETFSTPLLLGLTGILASAGKSVFLFSPPLVLGFLGWSRFRERSTTRLDALLFLCVFVAQLFLYARWWDWSSDDAWGVRFLVPGVVFMCIPAVEYLERRLLIIPAAALGLLVQVLAVTVGGLDYLLLIRSQQAERQALYVTGTNRIDFEDIHFNPRYSQIAGNWILLRYLLHVPPSPAHPGLTDQNGTALNDSLPQVTWSSAAHWDFIWRFRAIPPSEVSK